MRKEDFFTGETPLEVVSPPVSPEEQMANIGGQVYGGPPVNIGGIGYNNYGYQGSPYGGGIGYNFGYNQPPAYTQYGYTPNMYQGNPAFAMMGNMQPMAAQDVTVNIPPHNPWGSEYLLPVDFEDQVDHLRWKYWWEQQTSEANRRISQPQQFGYPNYYGGQYYSTPYSYSNFGGNKYVEQYNEIKEKARQDRIDMNMQLSMLAHNYLGESYDENTLREMYTGKTITVPGITNIDIYEDNKLRNLVPFDNRQAYINADAQVSAEFRRRISPNASMNECFENLALVNYDYEMEKELHRRNKDLKSSYDTNTYKTLIRQKVFDEKMSREGLDPSKQIRDMRDNLLGSGLFPTLSQNARLADDGTLNITYSYNPNQNQVNNLNESQYLQERARFNSFLNAIPNALGGDSGG